MTNKVLKYLERLDKALDEMSDEELIHILNNCGITPETAKQYAFIENEILKKKPEKSNWRALSRFPGWGTYFREKKKPKKIYVCYGWFEDSEKSVVFDEKGVGHDWVDCEETYWTEEEIQDAEKRAKEWSEKLFGGKEN